MEESVMKKLMGIVISMLCGMLIMTVSFAGNENKVEIPQTLYRAIVQHFQFYMQYREGLIINARYQAKLKPADKSDLNEAQHFEYRYAQERNYYRGLLLSDLYILSTYADSKTNALIQQFEAWDQQNLIDTINNPKLPTLAEYTQWRDRLLSPFTFHTTSSVSISNPAKLYQSTVRDFELFLNEAEFNKVGKKWIKAHAAKDAFTQEKDHAVLLARLNYVLPQAYIYQGKLYGDLMLVNYSYSCPTLTKQINAFMKWNEANTDYSLTQYRQWEQKIIPPLKTCLFG